MEAQVAEGMFKKRKGGKKRKIRSVVSVDTDANADADASIPSTSTSTSTSTTSSTTSSTPTPTPAPTLSTTTTTGAEAVQPGRKRQKGLVGFSSRADREARKERAAANEREVAAAISNAVETARTLAEKAGEDGVSEEVAMRDRKLSMARVKGVRETVSLDMEGLICKDYKETGYCTFGDTCKFIHDRSDYMNSAQLDAAWEEGGGDPKAVERSLMMRGSRGSGMSLQQFLADKAAKAKARAKASSAPTSSSAAKGKGKGKSKGKGKGKGKGGPEVHDDVPPGHCPLCTQPWVSPMATPCDHVFCQTCILQAFRASPGSGMPCPSCHIPTNGTLTPHTVSNAT